MKRTKKTNNINIYILCITAGFIIVFSSFYMIATRFMPLNKLTVSGEVLVPNNLRPKVTTDYVTSGTSTPAITQTAQVETNHQSLVSTVPVKPKTLDTKVTVTASKTKTTTPKKVIAIPKAVPVKPITPKKTIPNKK